nr:unnamed protein product [Digitaria exilis]
MGLCISARKRNGEGGGGAAAGDCCWDWEWNRSNQGNVLQNTDAKKVEWIAIQIRGLFGNTLGGGGAADEPAPPATSVRFAPYRRPPCVPREPPSRSARLRVDNAAAGKGWILAIRRKGSSKS